MVRNLKYEMNVDIFTYGIKNLLNQSVNLLYDRLVDLLIDLLIDWFFRTPMRS